MDSDKGELDIWEAKENYGEKGSNEVRHWLVVGRIVDKEEQKCKQ